MWLEDDVHINNKITDTFNYHINEFSPNTISVDHLIKLKLRRSSTGTSWRKSGSSGP